MCRNEVDPSAAPTALERVLACAAVVWTLGSAFAIALVAGCMSENTGSSTVVGEQMVLPEIADSSDSVSVRVYESIKGARVWTARDSKVQIEYTNVYTNNYFGIVETRDSMQLKVKIEPLSVETEKDEKGE